MVKTADDFFFHVLLATHSLKRLIIYRIKIYLIRLSKVTLGIISIAKVLTFFLSFFLSLVSSVLVIYCVHDIFSEQIIDVTRHG